MYNKIEILKTPNIEKKKYKKFKTDDKVLEEIIGNFTYVLERELLNENLVLFYNNLSTLKVDNKIALDSIKSYIFKKNIVVGYYFIEENIISVLPFGKRKYLNVSIEEYIAILCHELLHLGSTIIDKIKKIVFSGFCQIIDDTQIGMALDDAYTEMLAYRYFNLNYEYMAYDYEIIITALIEEIIGKDKMTNYYFNANLYGLVKELEKYNNRESIIKFLDDFDLIYALRDQRRGYKKDIIYYHNEISEFIVKTYQNKLNGDLMNKIITLEEYNKKLDSSLSDIHMAFDKLNVEINKKRKRRNIRD